MNVVAPLITNPVLGLALIPRSETTVAGAVRWAVTGKWLWFAVCVLILVGLVLCWGATSVVFIGVLKMLAKGSPGEAGPVPEEPTTMDASDILFSMPTLNDALPCKLANAAPGADCRVMHEDDL